MAYEISLLTSMGISVIFALSLNLITGFCGQIASATRLSTAPAPIARR